MATTDKKSKETKYLLSNEVDDTDIRSMIRETLNVGKLPQVLCIHHLSNDNPPKHRLYVNLCGVNGLFAGCSDTCIATTMSPFVDRNAVRCLECRNVITLDSKIKIRHDLHDNSYLYCSSECYDKAPSAMTRCKHIQTFEFISTDRTQLYYGNDPKNQHVRRSCRECPIVYPTDEKLHCYECRAEMIPKPGIVGVVDNGRHFIHKNGTLYLVCSDTCKEKMERLDDNICQYCGLFGKKRCMKCGVIYCCRECQTSDWKNHKNVCRATDNSTKK